MAASPKQVPNVGNELLNLLTTMQATFTKSPSTTPLTSDGELIQRIYKDIERSIKEKDYARCPSSTEIPRPDETPPRALH
mgnify:FL=1